MKKNNNEEVVHELKLPEKGEVVGVVAQAMGASNFRVKCSDGFERMCSIPGRLKRHFWIKEGDIVLVKPWVVQSNERGDIIWRYSLGDKERLREKGFDIKE